MRRALWGLVLLAGCRFGAAAPLALPRVLPSQLGPVPVLVVDTIVGVDSTLNLMGGWDPIRRVIYVKRGMHPAQALHTMYHEACHLWSWDSGIRQLVHERLMQAMCDASASALVMERLNQRKR